MFSFRSCFAHGISSQQKKGTWDTPIFYVYLCIYFYQQNITKYIRLNQNYHFKVGQTSQQKNKSPKGRQKNQRSTGSHIQESHKRIKLKALVCKQRTWCSVHTASVSVSSYELCIGISEALVFLMLAVPSVFLTPSASSSERFPELWGKETSCLELWVPKSLSVCNIWHWIFIFICSLLL